MVWFVRQDDGVYRDYDNPNFGEQFACVTFAYETHTAYAMKANPNATAENFDQTYIDESVRLTWEQAETIVGETVPAKQ